MSGARALLVRAALSALVTAALVGAALTRLARVPRPRFVTEGRVGVVEVGGVWLGARRMGVSVRCRGVERWSRPGALRASLREVAEGVEVRAGAEVFTLRPSDCTKRP